MTTNERPDLSLPPSASLSRRRLFKLGGAGVFGVAGGGALLAACGNDSDGDGGGGTTGGDGGGAAKDKIKAHWVYVGPPDDNGWTQEHERARQLVIDTLGDQIEAGFTPNVGFDAATTQLFETLVADGNDIIFANTEYAGLMSTVAEANPDVKFVETNGHVFTENEFGFYLAHETTAYLMGVAAGLLTENGRIGYIGAFPTATAYNDVNGMLLGARSVNPNATVETVLVNTFFDPQASAGASDALLASGVEFLFGVMDEPTHLQKAEEAGVWTGYWNLDFREAAPTKYVSHFDLSAFGPFYLEQCRAVLDGTWAVPDDVVLLETPLGAFGDEVPQDVQDQVTEVAAKLASGELSVYSGPLNDNQGNEQVAEGETIDSLGAYAIDWAVEGVSGI